jgi:hypothetical protein
MFLNGREGRGQTIFCQRRYCLFILKDTRIIIVISLFNEFVCNLGFFGISEPV